MSTRKYVYVAGPYTEGEWGTNIRNAVEAAERIWKAGHIPFIPHTMTALWSVVIEREGSRWLDFDFHWVEKCDALVRLPGESPGGDKEIAHAQENGLDVYRGVDAFLAQVDHLETPKDLTLA